MLSLNKPREAFKNHKTTILCIVIILLFFGICYLVYREVSQSRRVESEQLAARIDTIIQYKTLSGAIAYKVYEKKVQDQKTVDSLAKELKIKNTEIEKYITIISKGDYSSLKAGAHDTVYIDKDNVSRIGKYGEYKDGWIDVAAVITDSLRFSRFHTTDTLTGVFQRTKIKGQVFNKLIVTNKSPYNKIVGLEDISIKEAPQYRKWSLGVHAGWDVLRKQPDVSIGINYALFSFKK